MPTDDQGSYPLPEHPLLADVARALQDAGHWGWVVDDQWRILFATDQIRFTFSGNQGLAHFAIGEHFFGPESTHASARSGDSGRPRRHSSETRSPGLGGYVLADTPGGRERSARSWTRRSGISSTS